MKPLSEGEPGSLGNLFFGTVIPKPEFVLAFEGKNFPYNHHHLVGKAAIRSRLNLHSTIFYQL